MFGIGMPEMLMILAVALIVIGPKKLPDLARSMGRALGEFKRATSDIKESIEKETGLGEVRQGIEAVKDDLKQAVDLAPEPEKAGPKEAGAGADPLEAVGKAFSQWNSQDKGNEPGGPDRSTAQGDEEGSDPTDKGDKDPASPTASDS